MLDEETADPDLRSTMITLLRNRGYFQVNDPLIIEAINGLDNESDIAIRLRELATDSKGPFRTRIFERVKIVADDTVRQGDAHYCQGSDFSRRN